MSEKSRPTYTKTKVLHEATQMIKTDLPQADWADVLAGIVIGLNSGYKGDLVEDISQRYLFWTIVSRIEEDN